MTQKEVLFISYARADGRDFAARLRERLEREGLVCWQDVVGMEGGRDWWGQIQEAVNHVEFLILIMTPAAMKSATVRKEWRYARQQGVCVYPVIATAEFSALIDDLPRWMRDAHFYNLGLDTDHFEAGMNWIKFLNDLRTRCDVPRVPFMADDLGVFIPRTEEYDALLDLLLDPVRQEPKAITSALALKGAGGYGKTTLARAICHDERIQEAFDDGVLWVTLGEKASSATVQDQLEGLIRVLSTDPYTSSTMEAAKTRLRELLADRDILMVIDDVWNADHLHPFLQGGERTARLITTRMGETLPAGARKIDVNQMTGGEAFDLLAYGLPGEAVEPQRLHLRRLAADLMEYPLPIKLANGILRERVNEKKQPLDRALSYVSDLLGEYGLALDNRQSAVGAALRASLAQLEEIEVERFKRLAIFFDDTDIPVITLQRLWDGRRAQTELFCERLENLSLLLRFDPAAGTARLHDVIRDTLLRQGGSTVPRQGMADEQRYGVAQSILLLPMDMYLKTGGGVIDWQREFLDRYRTPGPNLFLKENARPVARWADLPPDEPYLWDALAYHLIEAALGDELIATVLDLRYLAAKTHIRGAYRVEADIAAAAAYARLNARPQADALDLLERSYRGMAHILARCERVQDALVTLHVRLSHLEALKASCDSVELELRPHLAQDHPLPDLPQPALIRVLAGHTESVTSAAYSPDGRRIVSASRDRTVRIWDAETGETLHTLAGHTRSVNSAAFSPDGRRIVSASSDHTVRVWDAESGEGVNTLSRHTAEVTSAAFSPDGRRIVSASWDGTARAWDAETGKWVLTMDGDTDFVTSAAYSPDGRRIVSASRDGTVRVWDAETGMPIRTLAGHTSSVNSAAFSPDGRRIVSVSDDRTVQVWDAKSGEALYKLTGHTGIVESTAYSPDGRRIVSTSGDGTVRVWHAEMGNAVHTLVRHTAEVTSAAFSPDGRRIVSASYDRTVRVWDSETVQTPTGHMGTVTSVAFSPDGRRIVSVSGDRAARVWDAATRDPIYTLAGHKGTVTSAAYSPDGRRIISASRDRTVRVWDVDTGGAIRVLAGYTSVMSGAAFSPDGRWIVSASQDGMARIWDAETGEAARTLAGHIGGVNSAVFSPDGRRIVSASEDRTVRVWDAETGEAVRALVGHKDAVTSAAFSPDGRRIVSASHEGTVRIWDAETGEAVRILEGHADFVMSAAFSPDGCRIVSASTDRTLKVWDAETGVCRATFYADVPLHCCAWSPDGRQIAAGGGAGYLYWLRWVE
ncbi:MAG: NB-ARC domain-containing protein [Anaerolineae bacterium]|nr:NB-ARC domain-containing protein [Anaerolineae bacterium]NUQ03677.1 TIR domain-containing protein [Anaerolineae bacterium]